MPPLPRPKRRAANACEACHARKTRCSIPQTGVPCTNCALDGVTCQLRQRRTAKTRQKPTPPMPRTHAESDEVLEDTRGPEADTDYAPEPDHAPEVDHAPELDHAPFAPLAAHISHHANTGGSASGSSGGPTIVCSPLYGDPRSIGLVADICQPERHGKSGHFLVASLATPELDSGTNEFLRSRGVFELPSFAVCKTLVRLYFHYVHSFFPVLDPSSFLDAFEKNKPDGLSLHLLWSVFLAAANFADDDILMATGFTSRKAMKKAMFLRSKALYDAEYERDKTTLIQAVLLMGFWYADTEDRIGPWHWNGVALGLCTTIGLHRQPDPSLGRQPSSSSTLNRTLWQQLWWACFFREIWLSAGMGRPARLDLAYANTPKPDLEGFDEAWENLPGSTRQLYLPKQTKRLACLWRHVLDITVLQAEIISVQNRVPSVQQSAPDVERTESKLRELDRDLRQMEDISTDEVLLLHIYHAELFLDSVFLTLFRPFMLKELRITSNEMAEPSTWSFNATKKSRATAQHTNNILGCLMGNLSLIKASQALICIAIVPALQTHLLHASSPERIARQLGSHHLAFCMIALEELRKTYFGAEILFKLFTRAQEKLRIGHSIPMLSTESQRQAASEQQPNHSRPNVPSYPDTAWSQQESHANTPNNSLAGEFDVEGILSQCVFPDFTTFAFWDLP